MRTNGWIQRNSNGLLTVLAALLVLVAASSVATPAAAGEAKRGGTLVYGQTGEPQTLDTPRASGNPAQIITSMFYEHLVRIGGDGSHQPALAESWEGTPDLKTYRFKLRKGVKFHDGTPFNAAAVKFNYERFKDPKASAMTAQYALIEKIETPDDSTVVFRLNRPNVAFVEENVTEWRAAMVSPAAVQKWGKEYALHPVGTGPWKFVEWIPDDRIVLERNPDYWGGGPLLDKVVVRSIPDDQTRFLELERGGVHLAWKLLPEQIERLRRNPNIEVQIPPSLTIRGWNFNNTRPPFNDPKVRLAVYHAIDIDTIVKTQLSGIAIRSRGPVYVKSPVIHPTLKEPEYNPAKAKALLAEAGWKPGPDGVLVKDGKRFEITMVFGAGHLPKNKELNQAAQQYLSQVGIAANLREVEYTAYLKAGELMQHDMTTLAIGPRSPDPVLTALEVGFRTKGRLNRSGYSNPQLDDLLNKGASVANMEERKKFYYQAQEVVMKDVPAVFTHNDLDVMAIRKEVQGYTHSSIQQNNLLDKVWLR